MDLIMEEAAMADWTAWTMWGVALATSLTILAHVVLSGLHRMRWLSASRRLAWRRRARVAYGLALLASLTLPFLVSESPGLGASLALGIASFAIASGADTEAAELFETG